MVKISHGALTISKNTKMFGLYILDGHLVIGHASQVKTKLGHFV